MATKNTGQCMGGPWAGQHYVHWANSFDIFKPALEFNLAKRPEDLAVEPVIIGQYRFSPDQNGMWIWEPTGGRK
jgi:hypothetical protein